MRQVIIVVVSIIILILAFISSGALSKREAPKKKPEQKQAVKLVQVQEVKNKEIQAAVSIYGRLVPYEKTELFAEVGGMLVQSPKAFKEGTRFAKGELLLSIDDTEQQLNLRAQRAQLLSTITQMMPDIKIDYSESLDQWNEYRKAFDVEKALEELPTPKTDREKDFITLKNIYNQYYNIKALEERLTKYKIYAPFNGELTEAFINTGSLIRAGQKIATLMNTAVYELQASIPLEDLKYVGVGDQVSLSSEDVEGSWKGRVARISSTIETKTQTVKLYIRVNGAKLKENMFLSGEVQADKLANVIEIPRKLLINDNNVYVVKGDTALALEPVQLVKISESTALIKGLADGTQLLSERFAGAYDGMKVNIAK
jgi:membrane fusion protein (multidrug efflux system)